MGWFGEGPETKAQHRGRVQREAGYKGWLDKDNHPIASRTDKKGNALSMFDKGHDGRGTKDEERAKKAGSGRKKEQQLVVTTARIP